MQWRKFLETNFAEWRCVGCANQESKLQSTCEKIAQIWFIRLFVEFDVHIWDRLLTCA